MKPQIDTDKDRFLREEKEADKLIYLLLSVSICKHLWLKISLFNESSHLFAAKS